MMHTTHSRNRFALAVGSALAISLLIVVASLLSAAAHIAAYLT